MHASQMTRDELDYIFKEINLFYETFVGKTISLSFLIEYFTILWGDDITRPINHTLEVYGLLEREEEGKRFPFPMRENPWRIVDDECVPVFTGRGLIFKRR